MAHELANRNKALPEDPGDFAMFDFREMEQLGRDLPNARDGRGRCDALESAPHALRYSSMMAAEQKEVEG